MNMLFADTMKKLREEKGLLKDKSSYFENKNGKGDGQ